MGENNTTILNRVFSRNTLTAILQGSIDNSYAIAIRRYIKDYKGKENRQLVSEIYRVLEDGHRNEYYYKNTLLNILLVNNPQHNYRNTIALTEIPVGRSKVDFVLINGKAHVYEIKTELDNFDRLNTQIENYYKAFDHVSVVTCYENLEKLKMKLADSPTGIFVLTPDSKLVCEKTARENKSQLDHITMFKILRKKEYTQIILNENKALPEVSQFDYFTVCKELFCKIDINNVYQQFLGELKKRMIISEDKYLIVPEEMKSLVYFSKLRVKDYDSIERFLTSQF